MPVLNKVTNVNLLGFHNDSLVSHLFIWPTVDQEVITLSSEKNAIQR